MKNPFYLHPEEHPPGGDGELKHEDASCGALGDLLVLDVVGEDDEVVLDLAGGPVLPLEVHEVVLFALLDVDQT